MGSSAKQLNPEAKPWEPKVAIKASLEMHNCYPLFQPIHNVTCQYPPLHRHVQQSFISSDAAVVLRYNVRNQPEGRNGRKGVGSGRAAKKIDGGEWQEVVTYKCSVGPRGGGGFGVGRGNRFKGKERIVSCNNRSFGCGRKRGCDGRASGRSQCVSSKKMPNSGGEVGANTAADVDAGAGERTTVMIKNIPNQLSREMLLCFLDSYCSKFNLEYDFVYLPMDFKSLDNLGYAFVNFTSASAATKIREVLSNYRWGFIRVTNGFVESKKTCQVAWARLQGKKELVRNFMNSNFCCYTCDYLPVVLDPPRNGSNSTSTTATPIGKCRQHLLAPMA